MRLSWNGIRARAARFSDEWRNAAYEKGETQSFYNAFFEIFGVRRRSVARYEEHVRKLDNRSGFIDLFWPGVLIVEQKSAGSDLERAYGQAGEYFDGLSERDRPRYVLVSDFQTFELHDLDEREQVCCTMANLPVHIEKFGFILGVERRTFRDQDPVNVEASAVMGRLHDALEASGYGGHDLEVFLVRTAFCLFADDTGIFEPRDVFLDLLETRTSEDGSDPDLCRHANGRLAARDRTRCRKYLTQRSELLHAEFLRVDRLAQADELPEASVTDGGLKITPLNNQVSNEAELLTRQAYGLIPRIKITDLLTEVDGRCDFGRHFTHLRSGDAVSDRALLLTAILADGINPGLTRMADACPGVSLSTLSRIATWHIRDETYVKALAEVVDHHHRLEFAAHWGDGTTSSSDGQRFQSGGSGEAVGSVNARYGNEPGATFYTHISDQYATFHIKLISATVRDATHVLDGLLYHESDLHIEEHYTDTAGFTDHVFALCHLLGFRFAPRIRNLADTRLYAMEKPSGYSTLAPLIGGVANRKRIGGHWDEILRLATSIKHGSVTASLMLRKLGAYPRQNGLAVALRELGKIERTLFLLHYISSVELRRRIHVGLNKGEARNALARAVFFNRLGELRDRTHENQRHRASGLNLVVASIVLWNTVYLERAVAAIRRNGQTISDEMLTHLSPLKWEHINLTGDYHWLSSVNHYFL